MNLECNFKQFVREKLAFFSEDELVRGVAAEPEKLVLLFRNAVQGKAYEEREFGPLVEKCFKKIIEFEGGLPLKLRILFFETLSTDLDKTLDWLTPMELTEDFHYQMAAFGLWKEMAGYKYSKNKIAEKTKSEEKLLEDLPHIKIDNLPSLVKKMNVHKSKRQDYVDLKSITDEGASVNLEFVEEGFKNIVSSIKKTEFFVGVPAGDALRKAWYQKLSIVLKHVLVSANKVFALDHSEASHYKKRIAAIELINLGIGGHHCGERWLGTAREVLDILEERQEIKIEGLEQQIALWLQDYQEGFLEEMDAHFSDFLGIGYGPHIRNRFAKQMVNYHFNLKAENLITVDDRFLGEDELSQDVIKEMIRKYFHPMMLIKFIRGKLHEECIKNPQFPALALIPFKECAEKKIHEMTAAKNSLTSKKRKREESVDDHQNPAKKRRISVDEIDQFIQENGWYKMDEMMTKVDFTSEGVTQVLTHLNFFKKLRKI